MASQTTIPNHFDHDRFIGGCAEASSLGLPPGVAPAEITLHDGNDTFRYTFSHREQDREGQTTAWVYQRVRGEGKVPYHTTIRILND